MLVDSGGLADRALVELILSRGLVPSKHAIYNHFRPTTDSFPDSTSSMQSVNNSYVMMDGFGSG